MKKLVAIAVFLITTVVNVAFANNTTTPPMLTPSSEQDPLESINRPIYNFNQGFDTYFMTPVAKGYNTIVPRPIRTAANNFFENISMISSTGNDILQGDFKQMILDTWRFVINSTMGVGGLIDVAAEFGLPKHFNDMGVTFAKWGYRDSTYLVFPILGSTTVRDALGTAIDYYMLPYPYIRPTSITYALLTFRYITVKAQLVDAQKFVNDVALDPYTFTRDAYYQYRNNKIHHNKQDDSEYMYLAENEPADAIPGTDYVPE